MMHLFSASFFRTWRLQDGFGGLRRSRRACRSARGAGRAHGHWARRVGRSRSRRRGRSRGPKARRTQGHGGPKAQAVARARDKGLRSFSSVFIAQLKNLFKPPVHLPNIRPMSKVFIQTFPPIFTSQTVFTIFHFLLSSSLSILEGFIGFPICVCFHQA